MLTAAIDECGVLYFICSVGASFGTLPCDTVLLIRHQKPDICHQICAAAVAATL